MSLQHGRPPLTLTLTVHPDASPTAARIARDYWAVRWPTGQSKALQWATSENDWEIAFLAATATLPGMSCTRCEATPVRVSTHGALSKAYTTGAITSCPECSTHAMVRPSAGALAAARDRLHIIEARRAALTRHYPPPEGDPADFVPALSVIAALALVEHLDPATGTATAFPHRFAPTEEIRDEAIAGWGPLGIAISDRSDLSAFAWDPDTHTPLAATVGRVQWAVTDPATLGERVVARINTALDGPYPLMRDDFEEALVVLLGAEALRYLHSRLSSLGVAPAHIHPHDLERLIEILEGAIAGGLCLGQVYAICWRAVARLTDEPVRWHGPQAIGERVTDLIEAGVEEDRTWPVYTLPGQMRWSAMTSAVFGVLGRSPLRLTLSSLDDGPDQPTSDFPSEPPDEFAPPPSDDEEGPVAPAIPLPVRRATPPPSGSAQKAARTPETITQAVAAMRALPVDHLEHLSDAAWNRLLAAMRHSAQQQPGTGTHALSAPTSIAAAPVSARPRRHLTLVRDEPPPARGEITHRGYGPDEPDGPDIA